MVTNEQLNSYKNKNLLKYKIACLVYYSGSLEPKCIMCGYDDIRALSIDHINGGGGEHRRELLRYGKSFSYKWLIDNNFPDGYQILCMNCQFIKKLVNNETHKNGYKLYH